jgi:hypothetical protein
MITVSRWLFLLAVAALGPAIATSGCGPAADQPPPLTEGRPNRPSGAGVGSGPGAISDDTGGAGPSAGGGGPIGPLATTGAAGQGGFPSASSVGVGATGAGGGSSAATASSGFGGGL